MIYYGVSLIVMFVCNILNIRIGSNRFLNLPLTNFIVLDPSVGDDMPLHVASPD